MNFRDLKFQIKKLEPSVKNRPIHVVIGDESYDKISTQMADANHPILPLHNMYLVCDPSSDTAITPMDLLSAIYGILKPMDTFAIYAYDTNRYYRVTSVIVSDNLTFIVDISAENSV